MAKFLMKAILVSAASAAAYKYRYKIMNGVLSVPAVRNLVVSSSMKLPFVRGKMLQNIFE
ncbi:hypothetical protein [Peribacillus kribbensis]|uniref:hypothetical protein n=1 Tax=Peribacillus kribbensis TaxID=356658 RepID=UPI0003F98642|nr:hypothetical protein [Peribacillus kribbensis]